MPETSGQKSLRAWIDSYADWIGQLRAGRAPAAPALDDKDPMAKIGHELQLLGETLRRREDQFQQLFDLVEKLEQGLSVEDVLNRIFDGFTGLIPFERIGCAFLSEDGSRLTAYWAKSTLGPIQISANYAQPMAGSSLEPILQTNQPRIINDLEDYLSKKPESEATRRIVVEGGRSSLTCPLVVGRRPIGFLFFTSKHKNTYQGAHEAIFRQIASQVSMLIDKSRVYQQIVERNRQLAQESRSFAEAAAHDPLTGILNRGAIIAILDRAMKERPRGDKPIGVIMADIDHFKRVNDTLGHPAGDAALIEFTRRIAGALRESDQFGRYGGEEFLVIAPGAAKDPARNVAERLRAAIAGAPFKIGTNELAITASFGVAVSVEASDVPADVVAAADRALYAAKQGGRNRVVLA